MSFTVNHTINYTRSFGNYRFPDWVETINYSDLEGLFPEITEAQWPTVKQEILDVVKLPFGVVGETPGLTNYGETVTNEGGTITFVFDTETSFQDFVEYRQTQQNHGLNPDFSVEMFDLAMGDNETLDGRTWTNLLNNVTLHDIVIGLWLLKKYEILRGCIYTVDHVPS
jgi:hypothetical protein